MRAGRTGSVRETIVADGPNGPVYLHSSEWSDESKKYVNVRWTPDINKAKIWRYPMHAEAWLQGRTITVLLTGARVCNARRVEGWIEK